MFGSVVHGSAKPGSDLDLLIVPVDQVTRRGLRAELRQRIEEEAIPLAGAGEGPGHPDRFLQAT